MRLLIKSSKTILACTVVLCTVSALAAEASHSHSSSSMHYSHSSGHYGGHSSGHSYGGGGGGGGGYDGPSSYSAIRPYPGSYRGPVREITDYYSDKIRAAREEFPADQAELASRQQQYQAISAQAQAYESSLAEKIRSYHNSVESLEKRLSKTHDPKEMAQLRQWLNQESVMEAQAKNNIAIEESYVSRERKKMQDAAHNVSEDQINASGYSRVQAGF